MILNPDKNSIAVSVGFVEMRPITECVCFTSFQMRLKHEKNLANEGPHPKWRSIGHVMKHTQSNGFWRACEIVAVIVFFSFELYFYIKLLTLCFLLQQRIRRLFICNRELYSLQSNAFRCLETFSWNPLTTTCFRHTILNTFTFELLLYRSLSKFDQILLILHVSVRLRQQIFCFIHGHCLFYIIRYFAVCMWASFDSCNKSLPEKELCIWL